MFKELGQLAGMMRQLPQLGKLKEEMEKYQQQVGQITAEGDAGAGMVKAKVNGKMEVLSVTLTDDAMKNGDRELLEDLIRAAVNQAIERVRLKVAEEATKMASNLGLPVGMGLPGLS
ncbi:MAG: YbaB/EbfC family nucleoid-associated protein [Gemmataceae bacterium]|nr:YbaB/EbfC family nucleoid-associated protein [Gemmataceae bacterium]